MKRAVFFLLLFGLAAAGAAPAAAAGVEPEVVIWAWERPENLLFLKDNRVRVAFYAGSVTLAGGKTTFRPRRQPLLVPPAVLLTAVFRIENRQAAAPGGRQLSETIDIIARSLVGRGIAGLQLDFDCRASERPFLEGLVEGLKRRLPPSTALSVTVLASLSHAGSWIDTLPVDEAVPMLFRMGPDDYLVRKQLAGRSFLQAAACRKSVGLSLDEPFPPAAYLKERRIYLFNPRPWTGEALDRARLEIRRRLEEENSP